MPSVRIQNRSTHSSEACSLFDVDAGVFDHLASQYLRKEALHWLNDVLQMQKLRMSGIRPHVYLTCNLRHVQLCISKHHRAPEALKQTVMQKHLPFVQCLTVRHSSCSASTLTWQQGNHQAVMPPKYSMIPQLQARASMCITTAVACSLSEVK